MSKKTGEIPVTLPAGYVDIHGGIVEVLDTARRATARSVNALMTPVLRGRSAARRLIVSDGMLRP